MSLIFFFNDTATTEIYTLSLHDALPIFCDTFPGRPHGPDTGTRKIARGPRRDPLILHMIPHQSESRSEEHTSELQSQSNIVCRLLLEKKNNTLAGLTRRSVRPDTVTLHD